MTTLIKKNDNKVHCWCRKVLFVPQVVMGRSFKLSSQLVVVHGVARYGASAAAAAAAVAAAKRANNLYGLL